MLREIPATSQRPGEALRRWFYSAEIDLYIWQDAAGEIVAFQLCYDKCRNEHALSWKRESGFSHRRVDDGESTLANNVPILLAADVFEAAPVLASFLAQANEIPANIRDFVATHIESSNPGKTR
jgi:hypothetical protein